MDWNTQLKQKYPFSYYSFVLNNYLITDLLITRAQSLQTLEKFKKFADLLEELEQQYSFPKRGVEEALKKSVARKITLLESPALQTSIGEKDISDFEVHSLLTSFSSLQSCQKILKTLSTLRDTYQVSMNNLDKALLKKLLYAVVEKEISKSNLQSCQKLLKTLLTLRDTYQLSDEIDKALLKKLLYAAIEKEVNEPEWKKSDLKRVFSLCHFVAGDQELISLIFSLLEETEIVHQLKDLPKGIFEQQFVRYVIESQAQKIWNKTSETLPGEFKWIIVDRYKLLQRLGMAELMPAEFLQAYFAYCMWLDAIDHERFSRLCSFVQFVLYEIPYEDKTVPDLLKQLTEKLTLTEYEQLIERLIKYAKHNHKPTDKLEYFLLVTLEIAVAKITSQLERIRLAKLVQSLEWKDHELDLAKLYKLIGSEKVPLNNSDSKVIADLVKELRHKLIGLQISSQALSTGDVKKRAHDTEAHIKKIAKRLLKALPVVCELFTGAEIVHDLGKVIKSTSKALHVASFLTMVPPIHDHYKEFKKKLRELIYGNLPSAKQKIKMFARLFSGQEGEDQLNHFIEYLVHYYEEPLSRCHSDMGNALASAVLDSIGYAVVSLVVKNKDINVDNLIAEVLEWLASENIGTQEVIIINANEEKVKVAEIFRYSGFKCWDQEENEIFFDLKESDETISKTNGSRFGYRRANEQMVRYFQAELLRYKSQGYLPDSVFDESTLKRYQNASLQVIPMKNCRCYGNRLQKVESQLEKIEHQVQVKESQEEKIQKLQEEAKLKDEKIVNLTHTVEKLEMDAENLNTRHSQLFMVLQAIQTEEVDCLVVY